MQDTSRIKERIISVLESEGPSFPSPIASKIQNSILFTSAFLSELLSEKRLKITHMKVGSSPIYYLEGQEEKLVPFATNHLKSKEKDAFSLLKENGFLEDSQQDPAIRVALRSIRDFALPEEKNNKLYWRYFLNKEKIPEEIKKIEEKEKTETTEKKEKSLEIFDKKPKEEKTENQKEEKLIKKKVAKKTIKKKTPKVNEKFFNKIKEYLSENQKEISDIIGFSKNDIILKIKNSQNPEEENILVAYNKKTIREEDIIKAFKVSQDYNLKYEILSLGEPLKKVTAFIEALQKIKDIKKID